MSFNLQEISGLTCLVSVPALAIGSSAAQIAFGATTFVFRGIIQTRGSSASQPWPIEAGTGLDPRAPDAYVTLAAGQSCVFFVLVNPLAGNAVTAVQGPIGVAGEPQVTPAIPHNRVLLGAIKVTNLTNPFVPNSTALNAAGVTSAFTNLASHPGSSL